MPHEELSDTVLVLLGHGSTRNADSSAPVYQHAAELRRRRIFTEVHEAFWTQEPQVKQVVAGLSSARVLIAPLFISEGYFSDQVIPRALGFPSGAQHLTTRSTELFYCKPIGTHDCMTTVILARARAVVERFPFPQMPRLQDTTLFVAGHGTSQNANSRQAIDRQVELIRARNEYAAVQAIFLEEEPRVSRCYELAQTKNLVIVPFFVSDGMHTQEDLPQMLGEARRTVEQRLAAGQPTWRNPTERNSKLVWYAPAVGTAPEVADVILERAQETIAHHHTPFT